MDRLWDHQSKSIEYARSPKLKGVGIFSGMGSGKTRIALEVCKAEEYRRVLILCPKKVLDGRVWEDQLKQFFNAPYRVFSLVGGTTATKHEQLRQWINAVPGLCNFVIVNYDSCWRKPLGDLLMSINWDCVIADEAHRLKSAGSSVSKWAGRLGQRPSLWKKIALTGTPTPNSPLDVYGLYRFLDPSIFGTRYDVFSARYAVFGGRDGYKVIRYMNLDEMRQKMSQVAIRFETKDVIDLPEVNDTWHYCDFSREANFLYEQLRVEFTTSLGSDRTLSAVNILTKTLRLQQLCGGWAHVDGTVDNEYQRVDTAKQDLLEDILEDMPTSIGAYGVKKEPLVIFYKFTNDGMTVAESLKKKGYTYGVLSGKANDYLKWRNGEVDVLVTQIDSGSEGIDLTRAVYGIYYSPTWSLGVYEQSRARLHRPRPDGAKGQPVHFIHLGVRGSIDQNIYNALRDKKDVAQYLMEIYGSSKETTNNMS